jgi:hypothetical protein
MSKIERLANTFSIPMDDLLGKVNELIDAVNERNGCRECMGKPDGYIIKAQISNKKWCCFDCGRKL